jgi:hypothetical protein
MKSKVSQPKIEQHNWHSTEVRVSAIRSGETHYFRGIPGFSKVTNPG